MTIQDKPQLYVEGTCISILVRDRMEFDSIPLLAKHGGDHFFKMLSQGEEAVVFMHFPPTEGGAS